MTAAVPAGDPGALPPIDEPVPCPQCGTPMPPDRARWWTGYGSVCSEGCARDLIRDHEGGIHREDGVR